LACAVVPSEPKRVLIADDTASSRELLRSILEASDYLVAEAKDGEQVLEIVRAFRPHLVILDLQMPKLDGYATVATLRGMPALERTPVIALTAAMTQTVPEEIFGAGFTAYLVKPIAPVKLRQCVAKLLREP
jgi:two-component system, chemotaxis family, chemotaxis protein CheY